MILLLLCRFDILGIHSTIFCSTHSQSQNFSTRFMLFGERGGISLTSFHVVRSIEGCSKNEWRRLLVKVVVGTITLTTAVLGRCAGGMTECRMTKSRQNNPSKCLHHRPQCPLIFLHFVIPHSFLSPRGSNKEFKTLLLSIRLLLFVGHSAAFLKEEKRRNDDICRSNVHEPDGI